MSYAADLHLHSPYAYACSKNLTLETTTTWAKLKGIGLLVSADFTHPAWRQELGEKLVPVDYGLFRFNDVHFILGTEVSCVYQQGGRSRRVHLLVYAPDFDTVDLLIERLSVGKHKLGSDGRPTLRMSARDFTAMALDTNPKCIVIPAHVWTPWFGMLGSKSGFDSLDECFLDMTGHINALETGLSSDPAMMWPIAELASKTIVSFSDAHSPQKLGRELTVLCGEPSFDGLAEALSEQKVAYTVEFYPEEGKYHYSGHRKCGVRHSPEDTDQLGGRCPECGRPLTLGVLHRVHAVAGGREVSTAGPGGFVKSWEDRPPFIRLVPLQEIIAETLGQGPTTRRVLREYHRIVEELGGELKVLLESSQQDLYDLAGERMAEAILRARVGEVQVDPGYDGVFGTVRIWPDE
jgi:uncharacterized protein (TIGR00375 family)